MIGRKVSPAMTDKPVRIALEYHWQSLGQVRIDANGRLLFPAAPRQPGLYRFRLRDTGAARHYVGETDILQRRFQHYRTPGDRQQTNVRMNRKFLDHLAARGTIKVDIVIDGVDIVAGNQSVCVDLANKAVRRLLEHAALVDEAAAGVQLLNR